MKVCLLSPPYRSAVKSVVGVSSPPLGLAYLASVLREQHKVKIVDSNAFNYNMKDVRMELKKFYPDVVGITSTTPSVPQAYKVAKIAKQVREDCLVVLGGPHVSFLPVQTLKECEYVDVVVKGEGEATIKELIEAVEKEKPLEDVRGITFRKGNRIVDNPARPFIRNIDEIPFPSRDLLPMDRYHAYGVRYATVITSRGCPFGCCFCASSRLFGGCWRARSPENVLEEIKIIYEKYKTRNIEFVDDTFTLNQKRAEKICEGIIREGLDIAWGASSRVDTITRRLAEKMRKAGCWILLLGIESASQKILDWIGKKITIEQIRKAVKTIKRAGIQVLGSFIIGFPGETVNSVRQTISFAKKLDQK
ncbi:MAG: radical SAM protein [Candidatus Odinarchaeota archaeon]|nr:radical SAM protein [Candidatus Odinarchaeota archaeon]